MMKTRMLIIHIFIVQIFESVLSSMTVNFSHIKKLYKKIQTHHPMQTTTNENIQNAILFDVKEQAHTDMTLSEHITRLSNMRDFLNTAINNNRINLDHLRQVSRTQTSQLQTSYQMLQNQTKNQLNRLKNLFQPSMNAERKQLSEMKNQVSKINAEQLSTKKSVLNCQATIDHCQNQMGYAEIKANRHKD